MTLDNFRKSEFREWYERMSQELVIKLDLLRFLWGKPIRISPVKGAIGRDGDGTSQHYWEQFGEVRAIDILPDGIDNVDDAREFFDLCVQCGFRGIGFYPHWSPTPGFHVDVRVEQRMGNPSTWSGIDGKKPSGQIVQVYRSLEIGFQAMEWSTPYETLGSS